MHFLDEAKAQHRFLKRKQTMMEKKIKQLPEGKLVKKTAKGKSYYYAEIEGKLTSLRNDNERIEKYRIRKEAEKWLSDIKENLMLLEKFLSNYVPLPAAVYHADTIQGQKWEFVRGEQNSYKTDSRELIFKGVHYGSKSEMLIAAVLDSYGIEFKYEVTLKHGFRKMFPDFVVKRPKDGKIFFWEHAGVTGKDEYVKDLHAKLDDYHAEGINLWDNLIVTFDKPDGSLDMDTIEKVIKLYLL